MYNKPMKFISHRGNLTGPNSCIENHPDSIQEAINLGYDCEIDVWVINGTPYLGHDEPEHKVSYDFFCYQPRLDKLWIHCKNLEALHYFSFWLPNCANCFFHNTDDYTLTSKGIIWAYPGKEVTSNCVIVQNEWKKLPKNIYGVCSDYVEYYKNQQLNIIHQSD
jgi:hypothetical protein